jgi:hypothetical protein
MTTLSEWIRPRRNTMYKVYSPVPLNVRYRNGYRTESDWPKKVAATLREADKTEYVRCLQSDRTCFLTGKRLFFKKAVRVSVGYYEKNNVRYTDSVGYYEKNNVRYTDNEIWLDRKEHLLLQLKGL